MIQFIPFHLFEVIINSEIKKLSSFNDFKDIYNYWGIFSFVFEALPFILDCCIKSINQNKKANFFKKRRINKKGLNFFEN